MGGGLEGRIAGNRNSGQERKRRRVEGEGEYDVTAFSKHGAVSYAGVCGVSCLVTKQSLIRGHSELRSVPPGLSLFLSSLATLRVVSVLPGETLPRLFTRKSNYASSSSRSHPSVAVATVFFRALLFCVIFFLKFFGLQFLESKVFVRVIII